MNEFVGWMEKCFEDETGFECREVTGCKRVVEGLKESDSSLQGVEVVREGKYVRVQKNGKQIVFSDSSVVNNCLESVFITTTQTDNETAH